MLFTTSVDLVVLVITPEITSIADAYGMLKTIRKQNPLQQVGVVVNQVTDSKQGEKTWRDFCKVTEQFLSINPPYLGFLPIDSSLGTSLLSQTPVLEKFPNAQYSKALVEVRFRIEQHLKKIVEVSV